VNQNSFGKAAYLPNRYQIAKNIKFITSKNVIVKDQNFKVELKCLLIRINTFFNLDLLSINENIVLLVYLV